MSSTTSHQFASTGPASFHFGYGRAACPGRFFVAAELKLVLAHIIMLYDLKLPEGEGRPGNVERPLAAEPDPTKVILMKRRDV